MLALEPIRDNVIIIQDEDKKQHGRIILPDKARERVFRGRVVAVGPECPANIKPGSYVAYAKWHGTEYPFEGRDYVIIRPDEILGVIVEK